jgi:hypothetical protein
MTEGEPPDYVPTHLNTPSALRFKSIVRRMLGDDTYNSPELDALSVREWASDADMRTAAATFCKRRVRKVGFGQLDPLGDDESIAEADDSGGRCVNTDGGHRVFIDAGGNVARGNPHVVSQMPGARRGRDRVPMRGCTPDLSGYTPFFGGFARPPAGNL